MWTKGDIFVEQATEMTTEVRQQIDAELKKAGITEVRSEMVVASAQQTEMRVSSIQKAETTVQGIAFWVTRHSNLVSIILSSSKSKKKIKRCIVKLKFIRLFFLSLAPL